VALAMTKGLCIAILNIYWGISCARPIHPSSVRKIILCIIDVARGSAGLPNFIL
jgi:hypothetical protein